MFNQIRLFGRRKKQQQQQQQQQEVQPTPPREQLGSIRSISPAGDDDDIRPVKQLISMGFNRAQAIDSLERNGYDFQKALNALLGSQ